MSFLEIQFPPAISYGASGGPGYSTDVVSLNSGAEQRNSNWSASRAVYDASHGVKSQTDMDALIAFFRVCKGKAQGFRFKDWADFQTTQSTGLLDAGVGTGLPTYQCNKKYLSGSNYEIRTITKPVANTTAVLRGGSPVTFGAAAGNVSMSTVTGILTFVADASSGATSITPGATTQVILTTNPGTLVIGQLLYLSGFTGTDAALVNGLSHTISNVTGAGPYTFTLATNTSGKTITLGSGLGAKYPQVAETLTWAGEFDVPCRFDTDQMKTRIDSFAIYSWGNIPVVEVRI